MGELTQFCDPAVLQSSAGLTLTDANRLLDSREREVDGDLEELEEMCSQLDTELRE
jgi:hypothetical protein